MAIDIVEDLIVFNCNSSEIDVNNKCIHFLTHIGRHNSTLTEVISEHVKCIYTSEFNVWFLSTFFGADASRFIAMPVNQKRTITKSGKIVTFEFIDANHCPGAVMVLVQGDFGTFLHTGNYRFHKNMLKQPSLKPFFSGKKKLDRLYINLAFKKLGHNFPPRENVIKDVIQFIREHKKENIYICTRLLGKEDILARIAKEVKIKIYVDNNKMKVLQQLGYSKKLFTDERRETRLRVVDLREVTGLKMKKRRLQEKCVAIVLSAWNFKKEKLKKYGIHIFPASDHSSCEETKHMLSSIKTKEIFFIDCERHEKRKHDKNTNIRKDPFDCRDSFENWWNSSISNNGSSDEPVPIVRFNIKSPITKQSEKSKKQVTNETNDDPFTTIPFLTNEGPSVIVETIGRIEETQMSCDSDNSSRISFRLSRSDDENSRGEQIEVEPGEAHNTSDSSVFSFLTSNSAKDCLFNRLENLRESQVCRPSENLSNRSLVNQTQSQKQSEGSNMVNQTQSRKKAEGSNASMVNQTQSQKKAERGNTFMANQTCNQKKAEGSNAVMVNQTLSLKKPKGSNAIMMKSSVPETGDDIILMISSDSSNLSSPQMVNNNNQVIDVSSQNLEEICTSKSSSAPPDDDLLSKSKPSSLLATGNSNNPQTDTQNMRSQVVPSSQKAVEFSQNNKSSQNVCSQSIVYPFNQTLYDLFKKNCPHLFK